MTRDTISAAEIEKYGYCPLSWWLSRSAKPDTETEPEKSGTLEHEKILQEIDELREKEQGAKGSEKLVMWFAVAATIIAVTALSIIESRVSLKFSQIMGVIALIWLLAACFFLYKSTTAKDGRSLKYGQIVIIFAIVAMVIAVNSVVVNIIDPQYLQIIVIIAFAWLLGSTFFLYRTLRMSKIAKILRTKHNVRGSVVYADSDRGASKPELFVSETYGISGRPDYVIDVDNEKVPVDMKTGRTPRGPLFSHILQIGAYCILIEEKYGKAPPYGILKYSDILHEIDYDPELKGLVLEKVERMRDALKTGDVHRNHNRVGKCRTCSKKDLCPEKLA
jgi:CRISPR-associated exonuclease Cas4